MGYSNIRLEMGYHRLFSVLDWKEVTMGYSSIRLEMGYHVLFQY